MERILHFTPGFRLGGIETLLLGLYQHIDRDRLQFDFVTDNTDPMDDFAQIRSMGGRVHQLGRYLDNPFAYQKKFNKIIWEMNPKKTIFHSHDALRSGPLLLACMRRGIKHRILHSHTESFEGSKRKHIAKPILFLTNQLATQFLACSTQSGRFMFPGRKFSVFNNAIDLKRFAFDAAARAALRLELGISANTIVIGHTGRFTFQKNHSWIIKVFADFVKQHLDSQLLLVGEGPLENEMRRLASACGVSDKVIFAGRQNQIGAYLSAMDLFFLPSHFEGLTISLIEAQANGLPTLASDVVNDEVCLTQAIKKLTLNAPTSEWANALSTLLVQGRFNSVQQVYQLRAQGFDISTQWKQLVKFYEI